MDTITELYQQWIRNFKEAGGALNAIMGDAPEIPGDPRLLVQGMLTMTEETWVEVFLSPEATDHLKQQMDLQRVLLSLGNENYEIVQKALALKES